MKRAVFLLLALTVTARAFAEPVTIIRNSGPAANRIDLVVLGDGYSAAEIANGTYANHVETFISGVFLQEPYANYRNYFNVRRVDVTSAESGADKPQSGIFRNTAFDATYYCASIQRLICVNTAKVNNVLIASIPDPAAREMIVVLVNDSEYGGSGGAIAVASVHAAAVELILHEAGHSFGLLADEYEYGPPACSPTEPSAANATRQTARASIKWTHWIAAETPLPTGGTAPGVPGLYQGAVYCSSGAYRPTHDSKMRNLGRPFEQINSEQHVKRFYNYVSPIDATSPASNTITVAPGGSETFSVVTPSPSSHDLSIAWTVNGTTVGTSASFVASRGSLTAGTHTLRVTVSDPTSLVRNDPANVLRAAREWTVTVTDTGGVPDLNGDGRLDLLWHHQVTGHVAVWYMNGLARIDAAYLSPSRVPDTNWQPAGLADFNADGKTDVLWQHQASGALYVWYMDGLTMTGGAYISQSLPDPRWRVRAVTDLNGDGRPDLVLQHPADGLIGAWLLNGVTVLDGSLLSPGFTSPDWRVAGAGDFNADGKADLLFQHNEGWLAVWYLDGLVRLDVEYLNPNRIVDTRWLVAGVGDVNGDGRPDLILHHTYDGVAAAWLMNGRTMSDGALFSPAQVPDANWRIVGPR